MNDDVQGPAHALVYVGGGDCAPFDVDPDLGDVVVVAADGGCDLALAHDRRVDALVGDLDSVSAAALAVVRDTGGTVERHDPDKDRTDFELALAHASARGVRHVTVVGGAGGRLDHLLCNVAVLASPRWAHMQVTARLGDTALTVVHGPGERTVRGRPGTTVTLAAVHGPATGVHCTGLAYPLVDAHLPSDVGLGCSNVFTETEATVAVRTGTVVVITPDADTPPPDPTHEEHTR